MGDMSVSEAAQMLSGHNYGMVETQASAVHFLREGLRLYVLEVTGCMWTVGSWSDGVYSGLSSRS